MRIFFSAIRATALSTLLLGIPATVFAEDSSAELKKENDALRSKIDQILSDQAAQNKAMLDKIQQLEKEQKAQQAADLDQQKALEQKVQQVVHEKAVQEQSAAIDSVLRDADRHSRFFDMGGGNIFYDIDHGLNIRSDDGTFLWHPQFLFQFGYEIDYRNDGKLTGGDDTNMGFEIHRLRVSLDGHVFDPNFTYDFLVDSKLGLQDAWLKYVLPCMPNFAVRGGQFKNPFDHEEMIDDKYQLAFDRSYAENSLANGEGYVDGVALMYDPGTALRGQFGFTNGNNNPNSTFVQFPNPGSAADFGFVARAEYKVFGDWNEYNQFTSLNDSANLLVAGIGMDVTQSGHFTTFSHVLDAQWNNGPIGAFGSFLGRYNSSGSVDGSSSYDYSFRLQGSYLINKQWEAFARYGFTHFDGGEFAKPTKNDVHELTFGANYYLHNHSAKFTADVIFLPTGAPVADTPLGVLVNNNHGEIMLHGQFQLLL